MDTGIIIAVIGAIEAIGVAVIGALVARSSKRAENAEKARGEREQAREERDTCLYDLVFASASGTEVLLHQAHGEQVNGNVDNALEQIKCAKAECNHVFNRQAAKL